MWFWLKLALEFFGGWLALSIVVGVLWGIIGWRRNPPFEEYGDLTEGR